MTTFVKSREPFFGKLDFYRLLAHQWDFDANRSQIRVPCSRKTIAEFDITSKYHFYDQETRFQFSTNRAPTNKRAIPVLYRVSNGRCTQLKQNVPNICYCQSTRCCTLASKITVYEVHFTN
jgi:hypothetical protein